jgi:hypothetical protein
LPTIDLPEKPRMADFAEGTFMAPYNENLIEVGDTVIEADPVGSAVRQSALKRSWTGTALGLLNLLREIVDEGVTRSRDWPSGPEALSNRLRRAATFLRKAGVEISFYREGKQGARMISIKKGGGQPSEPSDSHQKPTISTSCWLTVGTAGRRELSAMRGTVSQPTSMMTPGLSRRRAA